MERLKRKIVLLGLVTAGLLAIGFILMSNIGIVSVSATQWTGLYHPEGVAIGDYDNDGLNDIAIAVGPDVGGKVTVYKSDGTTIIKEWTGLLHPTGVAIGDYDNDGLNDIAISKHWTGMPNVGNVTVYKSDGSTVIKEWTGLNGPTGVSIGDYDNDGLNDLAFAEFGAYATQKVTVYKSDGTTIIRQWTGSYIRDVAIGDYDNDCLNDIAFTEGGGDQVNVYASDGNTVIKQLKVSGPGCVAIGDYNNDGLNDLVFSQFWVGKVTVYYQTTPRTIARIAEPTLATLRGTLTNTTGYPIQSGSIRVTVKDSMGTQVWQDTFDNVIDNGRYNIPLGTKTTLMLIKGQIYNAILEVDADSPTFISADVIYGDNNPTGDIIKFVAN